MRTVAVFLFHTCIVILAQRLFYCAIPELCDDGIQIDPRIETQTEKSYNSCPSDYISCVNVKCGIGTATPSDNNGIATENAFPWHAFLQDAKLTLGSNKGYVGGGVLIDQDFVLTAAHKIYNVSNRVNVILGIFNTQAPSPNQTVPVKTIYYHGDYDNATLKNDIALLYLDGYVNLGNNVNIICSQTDGGQNFENTPKSAGCVVSGFGQTSFAKYDAPTQTLKQVHVPIVNISACVESFSNKSVLGEENTKKYLDVDGELCAGGEEELDACTQDGGSPLVCPNMENGAYTLVGLVNWGKKCGWKNVYGVYVNVSYYFNWIQDTKECIRSGTPCDNALIFY